MSQRAVEEMLPALFDSAKGGTRAPDDVYRRLQFLSRVLRHAPPAGSDGPRLLWLDAGGQVASIPVGVSGVVIGRDSTCDLVLGHTRVSRRHCVVRTVTGSGRLVIEDLHSSNGTHVNGRRLEGGPHSLADGDVLDVGGIALAAVGGIGEAAFCLRRA